MTQTAKSLIFPLLLVFYEAVTYLSNDMYLPALPDIMRDLQLSAKQVQLSLTLWFIGQASLPFFVGALSDRFGRRSVLLNGGIIYILATILCALTSNFQLFLLGRFLEGAMVAAMLVPGYACIHELYEKKEAIRMLALMGSIVVLAPALGPLFGGVVLLFTSWRGIFWIIAVLAIIAIALLYRAMPETLPIEQRQPLHFGMLLKGYRNVFLNRRFMMLMGTLGFIFGGFIAWISAGPLLVIENFQRSEIEFGVIQLVVFAVYICGNRLVKHLMERLGVPALTQLGIGCTLLGGILVFASAHLFPNALYPFIGSFLLYSFGCALCFSPLNRTIIESSDETMGIRVAFFTVCLTAFAALGSAMASVFFNGTVISLAYLITGAIVLACLCKFLADSGNKTI